MKILILGFYGHSNVGDESYKLSFPIVFPLDELKFVSKITEEDLAWCDLVFLGGGNVVKEGFLNQLVKVEKPIYAVSVGIEGEYTSDVKFKHVFAREEYTVCQFEKAGIPVSLMPDLGFVLQGNVVAGQDWITKHFTDEKLDLYDKKIAIVTSGYLIRGGLDKLAREALQFMHFTYKMADIIDETSASFIFLPFGTDFQNDDRAANGVVASRCKWWKKNYVVYDRLGVQETLDVVSASDMVISTRLHASIFSYSFKIPFVDITHHSKNYNFLESIKKLDNSVSYYDFSDAQMRLKLKEGLALDSVAKGNDYQEIIQRAICAVRPAESEQNH